jgi:radical SAM superfamily enzyme YgiQ (UPF0313 family)
MKPDWENILLRFQTPGKYLGTEHNAYPPRENTKKFLLCFPDDYTIGMSSLGFHTVGNIVNSHPSFSCERCFSPWPDMEKWMRQNKVGLFSLETKSAAKTFDILGFSFQYELCYTNFLNMLDLAGIEQFREKREREAPLIIGGGPACVNPEILSEFVDLLVIGEAETVLWELLDIYSACPAKDEFLQRASRVQGVFVPGITDKVRIAMFKEFDSRFYPVRFPVPLIDIPHNRINIEINRGCRKRCAFCQASAIYSPYREKPRAEILDLASRSVASTGYDEISLTSLSATDHPELLDIIDDLHYAFRDLGVSVVMSSMRPRSFLNGLADRMARLRKGGLTFAPETPCARLKKTIKKNVENEDIIQSAKLAARRGWKRIKLYFMVGLPSETIEDVREIPRFIRAVKSESGLEVNATVSPLVPQPHTAFERHSSEDPEVLDEKLDIVRRMAPSNMKKPDLDQHIIESVLARGDRSLSQVIYDAWRNGAKFDQWTEHFDFESWEKAFVQNGAVWRDYYYRDFGTMQELPWSGIKSNERDCADKILETVSC